MIKILTLLIAFCISVLAGALDFRTLSSDFEQTITNDQNASIKYEGSFYASAEQKALWIYTNPIEKKIYFNHNRVTIIDAQLEQVIITNLKNTPNLTQILKNAKQISNELYQASYEDLIYDIHTKNNKIEGISYKDRLDNTVKIKLSNQTIDTILDEILFRPNPPSYYDIITQ